MDNVSVREAVDDTVAVFVPLLVADCVRVVEDVEDCVRVEVDEREVVVVRDPVLVSERVEDAERVDVAAA